MVCSLGRNLLLYGGLIAMLTLSGLLGPVPTGEDPEAETTFLAATPGPNDFFGVDVAIQGDRILVGALGAAGLDVEAGPLGIEVAVQPARAYLIEPAGDGLWTQQMLVPPDTHPGDLFGARVALTEDLVIVGAYRSDVIAPDAGILYLFEEGPLGVWTGQALAPSDAQAGTGFGTDIVAHGDRILVGASLDRGVGAAYLFERDPVGDWRETKIVASNGKSGDQFGAAVAFHGNGFIVTAPHRNFHRGAAYLYEPDGEGGYTETMLAPDGLEPYEAFGKSVAASGDSFVIGAPLVNGYGLSPGSVFVYKPDGGGYAYTRLGPSGHGYGDWPDHFGYSVAMQGDTVLAGMPGHDLPWYPDLIILNDESTDTGAVYVFQDQGDGNWSERYITAGMRTMDSSYGASIAIDGGAVVVGAPHATGQTVGRPGAVYLYAPGCLVDQPGVPQVPQLPPVPSDLCA